MILGIGADFSFSRTLQRKKKIAMVIFEMQMQKASLTPSNPKLLAKRAHDEPLVELLRHIVVVLDQWHPLAIGLQASPTVFVGIDAAQTELSPANPPDR